MESIEQIFDRNHVYDENLRNAVVFLNNYEIALIFYLSMYLDWCESNKIHETDVENSARNIMIYVNIPDHLEKLLNNKISNEDLISLKKMFVVSERMNKMLLEKINLVLTNNMMQGGVETIRHGLLPPLKTKPQLPQIDINLPDDRSFPETIISSQIHTMPNQNKINFFKKEQPKIEKPLVRYGLLPPLENKPEKPILIPPPLPERQIQVLPKLIPPPLPERQILPPTPPPPPPIMIQKIMPPKKSLMEEIREASLVNPNPMKDILGKRRQAIEDDDLTENVEYQSIAEPTNIQPISSITPLSGMSELLKSIQQRDVTLKHVPENTKKVHVDPIEMYKDKNIKLTDLPLQIDKDGKPTVDVIEDIYLKRRTSPNLQGLTMTIEKTKGNKLNVMDASLKIPNPAYSPDDFKTKLFIEESIENVARKFLQLIQSQDKNAIQEYYNQLLNNNSIAPFIYFVIWRLSNKETALKFLELLTPEQRDKKMYGGALNMKYYNKYMLYKLKYLMMKYKK